MHFTSSPSYWSNRYKGSEAPWDLEYISRPLKEYFDQLQDKNLKILVPGAGPGHEVSYLYSRGFQKVYFMDFSDLACRLFEQNNPDFPKKNILSEDFFHHRGKYDLIVEQTFFCAFEPSEAMRTKYADQMYNLLKPGGKLVGLWWSFPLDANQEDPPYGGSYKEYKIYFSEKFATLILEACYNSEPDRMGKELFGIFQAR